MKQKFKAYSFVRVSPKKRILYYEGFDAIVKGTYSQEYGGKDVKEYSLYIIKNFKVINEVSWFSENVLKQIDDKYSHLDAQQMVEDFNFALDEDED